MLKFTVSRFAICAKMPENADIACILRCFVIRRPFGYMVGIKNGNIRKVPLGEVAGKLKMVDPKADIIKEAKIVGISFGDE